MQDFSQLSDEELDAIIAGGDAAPSKAPQGTAPDNWRPLSRPHVAPTTPVDTSFGMSGPQLGLAGAGGEMNELIQGIKEKAQLFGKPEGAAGQALVDKINAERAERARINSLLYQNPEANIGRFAANAIPAMAAPARLPAQVALAGGLDFLKPGGNVSGFGSELAGSAVHGGIGAGATYGVGKILNALGRAGGAATGQMTPEGEEALKTADAARRIGLPPVSIGQLDPTSALGQVERNLPGYAEKVVSQAKALEQATGGEKVPGIFDKGAAYLKELTDAARNRLAMGSDKYAKVDDFVEANGLSGYQPKYTTNVITNANNPGYPRAQELLEKYGWDISPVAGASKSALNSTELPLSVYHDMRVSTNRAIGKVNRMLDGPMPTSEDRLAKKYLSDLKDALDNDAKRWASQNSGNKQAMDLYDDATKYYRDVVAPTVLNNPLASKLLSKTRGFATGEEALRASLSSQGKPRVDLLRPTMNPAGEDITQVLRSLPDVTEAAIAGKVPETAGFDPLRFAGAAAGHPIGAMEALLSRVPGLSELSSSPLAQKLYFARNVMEIPQSGSQIGPLSRLKSQWPRAAWGAAQYPAEDAEQQAKRVLGVR